MVMRKIGVDFEDVNNRVCYIFFIFVDYYLIMLQLYVDCIFEYCMDVDFNVVIFLEILYNIEFFWYDFVIFFVMDCSLEFYIMDFVIYFFVNIRKIVGLDYVFDEVDVLRVRMKIIGISEMRFNMG